MYWPRLSVPSANPNVSPLAICLAIATSSAPLDGTFGWPSAPTSPASFMIFTLK